MRNLALKPILLISFIFLSLSLKSFAQELKTTIEQDAKFEVLLKEKQKIISQAKDKGYYLYINSLFIFHYF